MPDACPSDGYETRSGATEPRIKATAVQRFDARVRTAARYQNEPPRQLQSAVFIQVTAFLVPVSASAFRYILYNINKASGKIALDTEDLQELQCAVWSEGRCLFPPAPLYIRNALVFIPAPPATSLPSRPVALNAVEITMRK